MLEDFNSSASPDPQTRQLTSKEAQKSILQRFTVEETTIKQRMLAASRTVVENRFLFRCRDTALMYGSLSQFFEPDRSRPLPSWQNTINLQRLYEHNNEAIWNKSLRHGLAMLMCSNNKWQLRLPVVPKGHDLVKKVFLVSKMPPEKFRNFLILWRT